jgi:hypothetical protein
MKRNLGLKSVAVAVAFFVWYATNVLERDAERIVEMPVLPRNVPTDLTVVDAPVRTIAATLRGPRTLLEGVEESRLRFVLPVRGLVAGTNRLDLQTGRVEPELPRRLRVVRLQPGRIELRTERLHRRRVPVRVELAGSPAFGYSVTESRVTPKDVEVAGPASVVDELRTVQTVAIDVRGLTSSTTSAAGLEWVGDYVTFTPDRVTVGVGVEEVVVTRELPNVPVHVKGPPGVKLTPPTLALTIRGPQRLLHNFQVAPGAAVVDVSGLASGAHQIEVMVDLPVEVEVVTRKPEVHRVVIPKGRNP